VLGTALPLASLIVGASSAACPIRHEGASMDLRGRSLLEEIDFSAEEFRYLADLGGRLVATIGEPA